MAFSSSGTTFTRRRQVLRIYTNGKRADNAYGLSDRVGAIVRRMDAAKKKAAVSASRKVTPLAKRAITTSFSVRAGLLSGKFRTVVTADSLRVVASQRRISLIQFAGKWAGHHAEGATASIMRGQEILYPGTFIGTVQGLKAIRTRVKYGRGSGRGPLNLLHGPSPAGMFLGRQEGLFYGYSGVGRLGAFGNDNQSFGTDVYERVREQLIAFYVAELRRLYKVEGVSNG